MRLLSIILIINFLAHLNAFAQNKEIGNIRTYYYEQKAKIYKGELDSLKFEEQVDNETHTYKVYFDKKDIKLIDKSGSDGEFISFRYEYLIRHDSVIFIFTHDYRLTEHWSANEGNPKCQIEEYRIYLKNRNCLAILFKNLSGFEKDNLYEQIDDVPNKKSGICEPFKIKEAIESLDKCKKRINSLP
jgi:hypothetical protein